MELAVVDQTALKLREIHLPLPPELVLKACATTTRLKIIFNFLFSYFMTTLLIQEPVAYLWQTVPSALPGGFVSGNAWECRSLWLLKVCI